eukprot:CAMPEP_0205820458 /NCGR_PEP_ID=MMETSP0206-20130828/3100_1 /ASSEMBLY_ACC=CAM_ASM_000279 /TAXON_ID=36767 /ORGANISM="Euplotes focardii, Strain TN1" /LENGTH=239 /DNA_ID=CAMNT_0053115185 /DNA_START=330 /DNA_END=1050 /DNA_ORIENTATION=+
MGKFHKDYKKKDMKKNKKVAPIDGDIQRSETQMNINQKEIKNEISIENDSNSSSKDVRSPVDNKENSSEKVSDQGLHEEKKSVHKKDEKHHLPPINGNQEETENLDRSSNGDKKLVKNSNKGSLEDETESKDGKVTPEMDIESNNESENGFSKGKWPYHYKRALFVCCMLSVIHQMTFINGVTFFSNEIFTDGKEGDNAERIARIGTLEWDAVLSQAASLQFSYGAISSVQHFSKSRWL